MATQLLETKLYVPRLRRGLVARPRLSERLGHWAESKLTLISAPAGFGKTTLLAEWLAAAPAGRQSAAWVSLDEADKPAGVVLDLPHHGAADRGAGRWRNRPGRPAGAAVGVDPGRPGHVAQRARRGLANDIVLVLDDYHLVDTPDIQEGMAFLLEHLPPQIHLVIATRADPALPLSRLRGRGELAEVRAADLRFTLAEADEYLDGIMGLGSWPHGMSPRWRRVPKAGSPPSSWRRCRCRDATTSPASSPVLPATTATSSTISSKRSCIVNPNEIRTFLLDTSILARLTGPLCDAVTGQDGGNATLEALDRANLFLVPLDDRRQWYRYHHLFAEVLRARLLDERPERVPELHRRACEWYEREGDRYEAIRHAMAGDDVARAADLVELAIPTTSQRRQEATLRQWLEALPDELLRRRPVLSNAYAGSLLVRGEVEGVEERLRDAERWLDADGHVRRRTDAGAGAMVVVDEAAFRRLPGSIAVHRAGQARILGDVAGTIAHARRVLELVGEDDHLERGWRSRPPRARLLDDRGPRGRVPFLCRGHGEPREGRAPLRRDRVRACARRHPPRAGSPARGAAHLRARTGACEAGRMGPVLRGAADMHVGISGVLRERNDLEGAARQLLQSGELGEENGLPQNRYRSRVAMAAIRQAEGDLDAARWSC